MKSQKELEERICLHKEAYSEGNPVVSDQRYDELMQELAEHYPDSYILKGNCNCKRYSEKEIYELFNKYVEETTTKHSGFVKYHKRRLNEFLIKNLK